MQRLCFVFSKITWRYAFGFEIVFLRYHTLKCFSCHKAALLTGVKKFTFLHWLGNISLTLVSPSVCRRLTSTVFQNSWIFNFLYPKMVFKMLAQNNQQLNYDIDEDVRTSFAQKFYQFRSSTKFEVLWMVSSPFLSGCFPQKTRSTLLLLSSIRQNCKDSKE